MTQLIELVHEFPFPAERWLDIFFSQGFIDHLNANLNVTMTLEVLENKADTRLRTVRTRPHVELPGFAARVLGGDRGFSFLETSVHTRGTNLIQFSILPSVMTDKFTMAGTMRVDPLAPERCRRTMKADLSIGVFAVGGRIEEFIARTLRENYDKGYKVMIDYERIARETKS